MEHCPKFQGFYPKSILSLFHNFTIILFTTQIRNWRLSFSYKSEKVSPFTTAFALPLHKLTVS